MSGPGFSAGPRTFLARLVRIVGTLGAGRLLAQLLGLGALAIAARGISLEMLGGIAVIQSTVLLIGGLLAMQSGPSLIRFGSVLLARSDRDGFIDLLKAGVLLDLAAALVSALVAVAVLVELGPSLGVPRELAHLAPLYALARVTALPGLHLTVLRLLDRHELIAGSEVAVALLRVCLFAIALAAEAGAAWYLLLWLACDVLLNLAPFALALRELARRGFGGLVAARARADQPGFWRMIFTLYISGTLRSLHEQGDVVLVGWLAGPTAAGLYRIVRAAAQPVLQLMSLFQDALLPEMARLWAEGSRRVFLREGAVAALLASGAALIAIGAALALGGPLLTLIGGPEAAAARGSFLLLVVAHGVALVGIVGPTMLIAIGRPGEILLAVSIGTVAFLATALVGIPVYGAWGAALAVLAFRVTWMVVAAAGLARGLVRVQ